MRVGWSKNLESRFCRRQKARLAHSVAHFAAARQTGGTWHQVAECRAACRAAILAFFSLCNPLILIYHNNFSIFFCRAPAEKRVSNTGTSAPGASAGRGPGRKPEMERWLLGPKGGQKSA